jgi:hypothetical protein
MFTTLPFLLLAQSITYKISAATFSLTICNKSRALSAIELFMDSKLFYHFDIYNFDFDKTKEQAIITDGELDIFTKVYNGYSYGTIKLGYLQINAILYANSKTGKYSLIQFADINLGGGIVGEQNLKKLFERSIPLVDNK